MYYWQVIIAPMVAIEGRYIQHREVDQYLLINKTIRFG